MDGCLRIALVTPFAWNLPSAVNQHVADLAFQLKRQGHLPVVVASSDDPRELRRMRVLFRRTRGRVLELLSEYRTGVAPHELLLPPADLGPLAASAGIPVMPMGHSFAVRLNGSVANLGLPVDVTSRMERLMMGAEFDLIHVHEPIAPSLSFTALREARSPVVCTFHLSPLGVVAYELGQSVLDRFFDRLDARIVTFPHGVEMMRELYEAEYEVIPCGTGLDASKTSAEGTLPAGTGLQALGVEPGFALYVYRGDGRRAYRALLRALAASLPAGPQQTVVAVHGPSADRWPPRTVPRRLRSRVVLTEFDSPQGLVPLYKAAAAAILPYLGGEWLCETAAEAAVCGCPVVGPDLPPTNDFLEALAREGGPSGAIFSPSETGSMGLAFARVRRAADAQERPVGKASECSMEAVASRVERVYRETLESTSPSAGRPSRTRVAAHSLHVRGIGEEPPRRRLRHAALRARQADWINADLHVHSNFSKDCVSSVESILATAREIGLGALAIADHNEIEGAFLARELSGGDPLIIVAEEVKTAEGEVIGLFLKEAIPKGLSFDDTLSLIKEQGGLVYVPHPFDALRTTPSYRALVDNLHRIDVIETYNAKVALSAFNLSAERFAAKYNLVAGAGSDAHVLQGLGTAMLRMPRFSDPEGFMAALWEADIIARRKNLLYLQSLKLLQTTLDRVLPEE